MAASPPRRRLFGDDDASVALKAAAVSRNAMVPLVCVGEQARGDVSVAVDECRRQVEPVGALDASQPAGEQHVLSVFDGIRALDCLRDRPGSTRIVYGGSAGPGLYRRLSDGLDGLFLGRFGHDPDRFVQTIREVIHA